MGAHVEIVAPRYVVLTRLADSWIPRAAHADPDRAEMDAFRWRRIYGPGRTKVAEYWIPELPRSAAAAESLPAIDAITAPVRSAAANCTRSEEHTSELQSLMRLTYAVFCLKK